MQTLLPLLPSGASPITDTLSVFCQDETWTYFSGVDPIFSHQPNDRASFKAITSQLITSGSCRLIDISRSFGVPYINVKRAVKKFRAGGMASFFEMPKTRGATVLTEELLTRAQELLDAGQSRRQVSESLGIKFGTLKKAINKHRLSELAPVAKLMGRTSTKSQRSGEGSNSGMGTACNRELERVAASLGLLNGAEFQFESCIDLSFAGVLCALPALEANGIFQFLEDCFELPKGYYDVIHIVLLLAIMALCRIKTAEQLRFESPGELGRLIGLDRIPEVKTLRRKIKQMCSPENSRQWMLALSKLWMKKSPQLAGILYVDGHVRVYHGEQTKLPKRFVSREKLCLRGVTDYYINDALGQPFFVVSQVINSGMTAALEEGIIPQLLSDVPHQPSAKELQEDPYLHRFILVFDRECSSKTLFKKLWNNHRIACISYQKNVKDKWSEDEFKLRMVDMPNGETLQIYLAERGTKLGGHKDYLWVKEIRKLTQTGHQTSIITTAYKLHDHKTAAQMFSRWSQENFFGYMMQHYNIDRLIDYQIEDFPDPQKELINPAYRLLENNIRSLTQKCSRAKVKFASCELDAQKVSGQRMEQLIKKKAEYKENIDLFEEDLAQLKIQRKATKRHIKFKDLPTDEQFQTLVPSGKMFTDTIKMLAYRSETALANILKEKLSKHDDARRLICDLMRSDADLRPEPETKTLNIYLHRMANPQADRAVEHLITVLNKSESFYPGTNWHLQYHLIQAKSLVKKK